MLNTLLIINLIFCILILILLFYRMKKYKMSKYNRENIGISIIGMILSFFYLIYNKGNYLNLIFIPIFTLFFALIILHLKKALKK
ncbi:hypothetical protein BBD42_05030 [Paenibacillus sp. BIHB 4019]|uniref:Histidine kinase n=1 Tax=Paenibacillus sp. BIHB 4019 TaxID=1870819 RepID=A0A1B2DDX7_9BACL|nr:hypothetical protein BBD42_05030 [Paenibacillus sp. BIHB 4019]